jgi:ABC-2 type transport system permease protein
MNLRLSWMKINTIAQKDLIEVRQNKAVWLPMLILPLVFIVLLPLLFTLMPRFFPASMESMNDPDLRTFMENMPPSLSGALQGLDSYQSLVLIALGYMFAPFFLILPLMFSTVVAAESFAGERERKTMEALLYTSATDAELFLGKVLAALIPAIGISWGSFILYIVVVNGASYWSFQRLWFPLPTWYPLVLWITPALAMLGIAVTVLISAKQQTFMGTYQTSASLVVVVLALLIGQVTGVLYLTVPAGLLVGLVFWAVALVTTRLAIRTFNRSSLLTSIH